MPSSPPRFFVDKGGWKSCGLLSDFGESYFSSFPEKILWGVFAVVPWRTWMFGTNSSCFYLNFPILQILGSVSARKFYNSFFLPHWNTYLRFEPHPGLQVVKMFSKNKTFFTTVSCKLYEYLTPPFPDSFLLILWSELINFSSKQIFITNKNLLFAFYHKNFM